MDLALLARATRQLEDSLRTVRQALEFVQSLDTEQFEAFGSQLQFIDTALIAYFHFGGDPHRFQAATRQIDQNPAPGSVETDPFALLPPFEPQADRIIKTLDANLTLVCRLLEIEPPMSKTSGNTHRDQPGSVADWGRNMERHLTEADNIIQVARALMED
jgi:hypothetical protein